MPNGATAKQYGGIISMENKGYTNRIFIRIVLCTFLALNIGFSNIALAAPNDFTTQEIELDRQEKIWESIDIKTLSSPNKKEGITCFDVNERGETIVGISSASHKEVYIFNANNEYESGFTFEDEGNFRVKWNNFNQNHIDICFMRGTTIVTVDKSARLVEIRAIIENHDNTLYWYTLDEPTRTMQKYQYELRKGNNIFCKIAPAYSRLVKISPEGNETVIYDVASEYEPKVILLGILFILFLATILILIIRKVLISFKDKKRRERPYSSAS